MKKIYITIVLSGLFAFQLLFLISTPSVSAVNPPPFSTGLETNKIYSYNVTTFGGTLNWMGFDGISKYNTTTNQGGQIKVNVTGFHDKDPDDSANLFGSPMPYVDVELIVKNMGSLESNHTFYNVSNGEAAANLVLGYNQFQSGFVIPVDDLNYLKEQATIQDEGIFTGDITIEQTYHFISFDFEQDTGAQRTSLVYDKNTGLLVSLYTEVLPSGYKLELALEDFSLDINYSYAYDVSKFGDLGLWYEWYWDPFDKCALHGRNIEYIHEWMTGLGGTVLIEYKGLFPKFYSEPLQWSFDSFPSDLNWAWFDINITEGSMQIDLSLKNVSNRETATQMGIGYGGFQTGFIIPEIGNLTYLQNLAITSANPGEVNFEETDLTILIKYDEDTENGQETYIVYEKITGLLQWVDTKVGRYTLTLTITGYSPPTGLTSSPNNTIDAYPYLVMGAVLLGAIGIMLLRIKKRVRKA